MCVFILIKRVITLLAALASASGLSIRVRVTAHTSSSGCRKATGREGSLFRVAGCSRKASLSQRGKSLRSGPQAACSQAEAASSRSLSLRLSAALPVRDTIADPMLPSCHVSVEVIRHGITPGRHLQDGASTSIGISLARLSYSHEGAG